MKVRFASGPLAAGAGGVWVADLAAPVLVRIDPATNQVAGAITLQSTGHGPGILDVAVAADDTSVWVFGTGVGVVRIDPATYHTDTVIAPDTTPAAAVASALASGDGALWAMGAAPGALARIDVTDRAIAPLPAMGRTRDALAVGHGGVWAADVGDDHVTRLDPVTGAVVATIPTGGPLQDLAAGTGAVWAGTGDPTGAGARLVRIDPAANHAEQAVCRPRYPDAFHAGANALWEASRTPGPATTSQITRIDPITMQTLAVVTVAGRIVALTEGEGALWASVWDPLAQTGTVVRVDLAAGHVTAVIALPDLDLALPPAGPC